jgi:hypothetical protein
VRQGYEVPLDEVPQDDAVLREVVPQDDAVPLDEVPQDDAVLQPDVVESKGPNVTAVFGDDSCIVFCSNKVCNRNYNSLAVEEDWGICSLPTYSRSDSRGRSEYSASCPIQIEQLEMVQKCVCTDYIYKPFIYWLIMIFLTMIINGLSSTLIKYNKKLIINDSRRRM